MKRHTLKFTLSALALAAASPAIAKPPAGVGGGVSSTVQGAIGAQGGAGATVRDTARIGAQGSVNADARAMERANVNSAVKGTVDATADTAAKVRGKAKATTDAVPDVAADARAKAQGAANASVRGLSKASTKSALNVAGRTDLGIVVEGTTIKGSGGADVGTVSEVVVNRDGAVVGVKVDLEGGGTATIPASTLTVDGSTVVTSWVHKH